MPFSDPGGAPSTPGFGITKRAGCPVIAELPLLLPDDDCCLSVTATSEVAGGRGIPSTAAATAAGGGDEGAGSMFAFFFFVFLERLAQLSLSLITSATSRRAVGSRLRTPLSNTSFIMSSEASTDSRLSMFSLSRPTQIFEGTRQQSRQLQLL